MSDAGDEGIFDIEGGDEGEEGAYTETEHEDLGDRLSGACCGICIGLLLFFGSFPLLFWNEGRAVDRYDALNEAESQTASIRDATVALDPKNEGKLLHFSIDMTNGGVNPLLDPTFGIPASNGSLALRRDAEMYQWVENVATSSKKTLGGGKTTQKTYTYQKEWRGSVINSDNFKQSNNHTNPTSMEFESITVLADPIMIGSFEFPQEFAYKINWETPLGVEVRDISDESIRTRATREGSNGGSIYFDNGVKSTSTTTGTLTTLSTLDVGDQRVKFYETPSSVITIVGVQSGNTLSAFVSESGGGGDVLLFKRGTHTAQAMYDEAESANAAVTWILRLVGFLLMAGGMYLVFRPVEVFADIVPCVGSIIGCGIIFVSVFISAILSSITISIAWLVAHPKIGAIVLVVTLGVVGCCALGVKKLEEVRGGGGKDEDDEDEKS